ncbi:MAG: glycosyltransferase family 4 protein [Armatimonadetes bacterium]|nr:glycosyltransferase family 4 protein [Armatimonadota bacterium]MCX7778124.1 glycosyltransferase family 4 protein [Armatimonadota bacterium]
MRIGYDARPATMHWTGMRTYMLNLVSELAKQYNDYEAILYYHPGRGANLTPLASNVKWMPLNAPSGWWWTIFQVASAVRQNRVELFHAEYIIPPLCTCPTAVTMHDAISAMFIEPSSVKARIVTNALSFISLHRSKVVLVPSLSAKRDVIRLFKVNPKKVFVTPYGVSAQFKPMEKTTAKWRLHQLLGISGRFILTVNFFRPRKNAHVLTLAFRTLIQRGVPIDWLVLAGASTEQMKQSLLNVAGEAADRLIFTGYVSDEVLVLLYNAADVFAFPSRYEGFGLPVLEAMACGTPVVAGNAPAVNEFASKVALLVDPNDYKALADAIERVLTDNELSQRLVMDGFNVASSYTWDKTAKLTMQAYRAALKAG